MDKVYCKDCAHCNKGILGPSVLWRCRKINSELLEYVSPEQAYCVLVNPNGKCEVYEPQVPFKSILIQIKDFFRG